MRTMTRWMNWSLCLGVMAAGAYLLPVAFAQEEENGEASLVKEIVDGPEDGTIEVGLDEPTEVTFAITYSGPENVVILDTVPAEWEVLEVEGDGEFEVFAANARGQARGNAKAGRSATKIVWHPEAEDAELVVTVETRARPVGGGNAETRFAPTSPGEICLNDGAVAFEIDEDGNIVTEIIEVENPDFDPEDPDSPEFIEVEVPVIVAESNALCLEAVEPEENGNDDE